MLHTRGMRKFARPDLLALVEPADRDCAADVLFGLPRPRLSAQCFGSIERAESPALAEVGSAFFSKG